MRHSAFSHRKSLSSVLTLLFFFLLFCVPMSIRAQVLGGEGVTLRTYPEYPQPFEETEIVIDDYSVNTTGATINWYVNNKKIDAFTNERSLTLLTGKLGEKTTVQVVLSRPNTPPLSATRVITPIAIDLILEAETYTPYFYRGRALPTADARARAIAVVHDGTRGVAQSYTYKWSIGDSIVSGGSLVGKNVLDFTIPHYNTSGLSVEVYNSKSERIGVASMSLEGVQPELHFYESSPLRGLGEKEVRDTVPFVSDEITLFAEPYYMNTGSKYQNANFVWKLNGTKVTEERELPHALTLQKASDSGAITIQTDITTRTTMPQFLTGTVRLEF
jgi:hypothetical protein